MTDENKVSILSRTTVAMSGALAAVANGATVKAAAEAHGLRPDSVYKAMRRHKMREGSRCQACGRLMPGKRAAAPT